MRGSSTVSARGVNFGQFLVLAVGIACIAAGTWNLPTHLETRELETKRGELHDTLNDLHKERARYARMREAFHHDSHYREGMIRLITGERLDGEFTVDEWIRLREQEGRPAGS